MRGSKTRKMTIPTDVTENESVAILRKMVEAGEIPLEAVRMHLNALRGITLQKAQKAAGVKLAQVETAGPIKARCLSVVYHPGGSQIVTGKTYEPANAVAGGNGTYVVGYSADFNLVVEVAGKKHEVWIKKYFKSKKCYLDFTKKNRELIASMMPEEVEVKKAVSRKGTEYFVIAGEQVLEDWADRVMAERCLIRGY